MQPTHNKLRFDIVFIFILLAIPIGIWLMMQPISERFNTSTMILTSIGQLTGLVGMTLVALSMIFQVRLSKYFNLVTIKPTAVTDIHHYLGVYGLLLLLIHPIILAVRFLPISLALTSSFLFTTNLINLSGTVALFIMIISIYVSLFVPRTFRFWKLLHQIMLIAYAFILYHLLFVSSDITRSVPLRSYILIITILGGVAFGWQKVSYYINKFGKKNEISN
ncbi:MAG: ferric reductase-like transmembrane domain-containing protein [bacterium]